MPSRIMRTALAVAAAGVGLLSLASQASAKSCDRICLIGVANQYFAAIVAHDPSKAPLAPNVMFVENVKRMKPGEGLWKVATAGPTAFRVYVPDVAKQQIGGITVLDEGATPMMVAFRLKVVNGKITQAEHIVSAPMGGAKNPNIAAVRPGLLTAIPADKRLPESRLLKIGATYYDALDDNNGAEAPFAADCQRRENGMTTAGPGAGAPPTKETNKSPIAHDCAGQISSGSFIYIDQINNRRMIAADPVTGLVMGISQFRHPFTNLPYKVKHLDGSTSERNHQNMKFKPFDMPAAHIFKVGPGGHIHEIEAVGFVAPYHSPSGWAGTSYAATWMHPRWE
jgi:hypothetical protein